MGTPVDLAIPKSFESIAPLIDLQPYIGQVFALDTWAIQDTAPISPRTPPNLAGDRLPNPFDTVGGPYQAVTHLGYRGWPLPDVVRHTRDTAVFESASLGYDPLTDAELDLQTPWITVPSGEVETLWICGFTDEFFELKYGLWQLLTKPERGHVQWNYQTGEHPLSICTGPRWQTEAGHSGADWLQGARWLARTGAFLGDCSAWHVLAVAMGVPVILMEPQPMRHNAVFYPLGTDGPQVTLVKGTDGLPTFDARHVADTLTRILGATR